MQVFVLCSAAELDDARSKFRIVVYSVMMLSTIGASHYYIRRGKKIREERDAQLLKDSKVVVHDKKSPD